MLGGGVGALSQILGRTLRLDHCACGLGDDLQMARAALGGDLSSQDGMKLGCHQVSGMRALVLTISLMPIAGSPRWILGVGPKMELPMGPGATKEYIISAPALLHCPLIL